MTIGSIGATELCVLGQACATPSHTLFSTGVYSLTPQSRIPFFSRQTIQAIMHGPEQARCQVLNQSQAPVYSL
ncbi:hypothetical protein M440DRAFT_1396886 [Trichoderma longibrachiatum ATCC 18648]|uniref:Uncharacterized protein n=1 Tax=Trichoderma longibrachiatum ATCC 18648 TaxID=983965 RepID=A0A2T4CJF8_TRILO|nr:hypothetical protein M440DRAFT_1396886 [Trichoderma longibrachiatum ATCC 18648]